MIGSNCKIEQLHACPLFSMLEICQAIQLVTWISPEFRHQLVCDMVLQVTFDVIRTVDGNEYKAPQFVPVR